MTGFKVEWYFMDENGVMDEIMPDPKYLTYDLNVLFMRLVTIVYTNVSLYNGTVESMWQSVKRFRLEWLNLTGTNAASKCYTDKLVSDNFLEIFLDENENELSTDPLLTSSSINKNQVTDSLVQSSAELYLYIMNCPNIIWINWGLLFKDLIESKNYFAEPFPYKQCFSLHKPDEVTK